MCIGCYEEAGRPEIVSDKTKYACALVSKIYEYSCVGSNMHIVTDDWNLEDESIDFCLNAIRTEPYHEITPEQKEIEYSCALAFKNMTMDERASALAIFDGYLDINQAKHR